MCLINNEVQFLSTLAVRTYLYCFSVYRKCLFVKTLKIQRSLKFETKSFDIPYWRVSRVWETKWIMLIDTWGYHENLIHILDFEILNILTFFSFFLIMYVFLYFLFSLIWPLEMFLKLMSGWIIKSFGEGGDLILKFCTWRI